MRVCVWGGGERKEARARPCVRGKNWAMDTKFNALIVKKKKIYIFVVVVLFVQFLFTSISF